MAGWTENDGYESDPQLQKFIEDNYILVDELTLVKGAKPIDSSRGENCALTIALISEFLGGS